MTQTKESIMRTRLDYTPLIEKAKTAAAMVCIIIPVALVIWVFLAAGAAL